MRRKALARGPGGGAQVYAELKETPFSRLAEGDLLDSGDIARLYGVSTRSVYRWMRRRTFARTGKPAGIITSPKLKSCGGTTTTSRRWAGPGSKSE